MENLSQTIQFLKLQVEDKREIITLLNEQVGYWKKSYVDMNSKYVDIRDKYNSLLREYSKDENFLKNYSKLKNDNEKLLKQITILRNSKSHKSSFKIHNKEKLLTVSEVASLINHSYGHVYMLFNQKSYKDLNLSFIRQKNTDSYNHNVSVLIHSFDVDKIKKELDQRFPPNVSLSNNVDITTIN